MADAVMLKFIYYNDVVFGIGITQFNEIHNPLRQ